ncbi:vacuolar sorting protein 9 (VPS9) domain containing protein [Babesia divergens]|uniref:Vacuolar sorting protein 9 (VPS9) domain containing protein n=1 Tax=Babesia divergens TaxID=32595 RepID=A0AAD9LIA4_BABDI|nr:vacuolar sorting protein 9 (VPS9) domain containing protein [Babesia divergens]
MIPSGDEYETAMDASNFEDMSLTAEPTVEGKADDTPESIDTMDLFTSSVPSFDITIAGKVEYDTADIPSDMVSESGDDGAISAKGCGTGSSTVIRGHGFNVGDYEGYDGMPLHTVKSEASYTIYSQASDTSLAPQGLGKTLTPYNRFLEHLKHPSCMDIIRAVKGLLAMFPGKMSRPEAAAVVHNFIDIYTPKLLSLEAFIELPDDERNMAAEFFEKFTMQKLYAQCYSMDTNDRIEDEKLWIKIRCLEWVEPKHLEISSAVDDSILKEAQAQLNNISKFKAPRDKLVGILNCCRLVVHSLEGSSDKLASADETLPLLIYVTIRANPHELWSSIEYIQHFRHPSRHIAEEAYGFTLLVSAVEYIKAIGTTSHFKMDVDEFNRLFREAQEPYLSRLHKLDEAQKSVKDAKAIRTSLAEGSVFSRLKRMAQPALMFKSMIFKNLASTEIHEAVEALAVLETYMLDMPLVFKPDKDFTTDSAALLSDWRALTAMREVALGTIAKVKGMLSNVSQ